MAQKSAVHENFKMTQQGLQKLISNSEPEGHVSQIIVSKEMLEEECQLEEQAIVEEHKLRQNMLNEEKKIEEEACFKRLHLLLSRSSIYAKFMAEKLEKHESIQKKRDLLKDRQNLKTSEKEFAASPTGTAKTAVKRKLTDYNSSRKKQKSEVKIVDVFRKENMANMFKESTQNIPSEDSNSTKSLTAQENQPALFYGGTMHSYQLEGYEWLKTLFENGVNGILADEMGLGKTIQSIAFVSYLIEMGVPGPFFVCGPLSTAPNWYAEFKRFTPDIPVMLYHGNKDERQVLRSKILQKHKVNKFNCCSVVITSFQIALIDAPKLSHIGWKMLIIDEAHRIKNFQCKLVGALKNYNAIHRLLLTGTPLQNNLSELWSLLNFILPEIFDDLQVFQSWFDITKIAQNGATQEIIAKEQENQIISIIHQILTPFLLRRTKSDVKLNLPPKKEVIVRAPLSTLQQKYYTSVLNNTLRKLLETDNETIPENSKREVKKTKFFGCEDDLTDVINSHISSQQESTISEEPFGDKTLSELHIKLSHIDMCLRKICGHPYLISYPLDPITQTYRIDEDIIKTSGKLLVLDTMLPELKKRGHKIVLFSQFVTMLEVLEDYCTFRNYKFCRLYGKMNLSERQEQLEEFKDDSVFIFLISSKAGGLGINLVSADTVIIYDSDWNPQGDLQAQDRCHRIGQTKPVVVYRLLVPNTVDQKIFDYATAKRKLEKVIIQKGRFSSKNSLNTYKAITKEELLELLESSDINGFINTDENCVLSPKELEKLLDRSDMK